MQARRLHQVDNYAIGIQSPHRRDRNDRCASCGAAWPCAQGRYQQAWYERVTRPESVHHQ